MKFKRTILFILISTLIIACENKTETTLKGEDTFTALTLLSKDSIDLKLTKIYNVGTMNIQEEVVLLEENKNFTIAEKLDKLLLCYAIADNGSVAFYIGPDMERSIQIKENDSGSLELIFDKEDFVNKFTRSFHEKLNSLFSLDIGNEKAILSTIDKVKLESLSQLDEIKSKISDPSYNTLKAMVSGKMAHFKFMLSERIATLTSQSGYYDFTNNIDFDNDYYLIYSDNLNTIYNTLEIQYERKYKSSFKNASNQLEFINGFIKNDEVRSQFISFILSREIPEKTEQEKQKKLAKLANMKVKEKYYQHITSIESGSALGAKIGNQAKFLETLISENKDFNIESLKGKVLYIDNWATWCGPCVKSMKMFLNKYNELNKIEGVSFVFVSFDRNESTWREYIKKNNFPEENVIHLYNGSDMKSTYSKYYNILGLPLYLVVNPDGTISDLNPSAPSDEDFEQFIKKISAYNKVYKE
ncbi:TlpA family protein disulfide reductase [Ancylomarina sp. YFZ004]